MPSESHYRQLMQSFSSPFLPKKAAKAAKPRSSQRFERICNPLVKSLGICNPFGRSQHYKCFLSVLSDYKSARTGGEGTRGRKTSQPEREAKAREAGLHIRQNGISFCDFRVSYPPEKTRQDFLLLHAEETAAARRLFQHSTLCWPILHGVLLLSPRSVAPPSTSFLPPNYVSFVGILCRPYTFLTLLDKTRLSNPLIISSD